MSRAIASTAACTQSSAVHSVHRLRAALDQIPTAEALDLPAPTGSQLYARKVIFDSDDLVIVAARWRAGSRCELHGHAESAGLYRSVTGDVEEERYLPSGDGYTFENETLHASEESFLPPGSIHQLRAK